MAKMFYSLEEAAERLNKSQDEVLDMASRGEITEFRDGDRQIFKVDQIDLLASDDESSPDLNLSDTGVGGAGGGGSTLGLSLEDTGGGTSPGMSLEDTSGGTAAGETKEQTGISVFDADDPDTDDPAAQTQIEDLQSFDGLDEGTMESFGSGSGLMDLTQESDDTSLGGAALLDDLGGTAAPAAAAPEGQLFEGEEDEAPAAASPALVAAEPYDGGGSGFSAGVLFAATLALILGVAVALMGMMGYVPTSITTIAGEWTPAALAGGFAAAALIFGVIGGVIGAKA